MERQLTRDTLFLLVLVKKNPILMSFDFCLFLFLLNNNLHKKSKLETLQADILTSAGRKVFAFVVNKKKECDAR